jgi:hypothetical protein
VWTPEHEIVDLNWLILESGWTLNDVYSISDNLFATGVATYDPDGPGGVAAVTRIFGMSVPEPTSLTALLGAVTLLRRTRKRF